MDSVTEFVKNQTTSIFSKSEPQSNDLISQNVSRYISIGIVLFFVGIILAFFYTYPEKYQSIIGSALLYLHMGKPNELHTTQSSDGDSAQSMFDTLGINAADLLPF